MLLASLYWLCVWSEKYIQILFTASGVYVHLMWITLLYTFRTCMLTRSIIRLIIHYYIIFPQKDIRAPFSLLNPPKESPFSQTSWFRTTESRYNKYNRTPCSVHQMLFGLLSQGCFDFMHSQARSWNIKITLISFVLFLKILTSLRSVNILQWEIISSLRSAIILNTPG